MIVADAPYNVPIDGHAVGRGKTRHREFTMAAGEMSEEAYTAFLGSFIRNAIAFSANGSIHYLFIDWRHLPELLAAARPLYLQWKNLLEWNKNNAGQGSEQITVREGGQARRVTKQRALIKSLTAQTLQGDVRATTALLSLYARVMSEPTEAETNPVEEDELLILRRFGPRLVNSLGKKAARK